MRSRTPGDDRATLAEWVGALANLVDPLVQALGEYVMRAEKPTTF
jgi:hypothetical protein